MTTQLVAESPNIVDGPCHEVPLSPSTSSRVLPPVGGPDATLEDMSKRTTRKPVERSKTLTFSISCARDELARIDARAEALGLNRSTYLLTLARDDYLHPQPFTIVPKDKLTLPPG